MHAHCSWLFRPGGLPLASGKTYTKLGQKLRSWSRTLGEPHNPIGAGWDAGFGEPPARPSSFRGLVTSDTGPKHGAGAKCSHIVL